MASKPLLSGVVPDPLVFVPDAQQLHLVEMAAGPVESQFIKELQKNPSDQQVRNEYADWLIDMGRSEFTEYAVRNTLFVPGGKVIRNESGPKSFPWFNTEGSGAIQPYPGIVASGSISITTIASGAITPIGE